MYKRSIFYNVQKGVYFTMYKWQRRECWWMPIDSKDPKRNAKHNKTRGFSSLEIFISHLTK